MDLIQCAHDISDGGLMAALFEMTRPNNLGFDVNLNTEIRVDAVLFGEAQSRVIVGVLDANCKSFEEVLKNFKPSLCFTWKGSRFGLYY